MSASIPPTNENGNASNVQRVAIAAGTLVVVILTVVIALFLAAQDFPTDEEETPAVVLPSPTFIAVNTPTAVLLPSATSTPTPSPTDLPTATPTDTPESPTATPSPTDTNTPVPPPPTFTSTPVVVTATPVLGTPTPVPGAVCQPPPAWVAYQAQPGDTLNSLARRTDTSVFDLQQVNCLESVNLDPGQTVYLPFTPPTPTETRTPGPTRPSPATPTRTPTAIRPIIDDVVPDRVDENTAQNEVDITVFGRNFRPTSAGFRVELRGPQTVSLDLGEARSDTSFDAIVPGGLPVGTYDLIVTNPNTNRAGVKESAFIIGEAPPTVTPSPRPVITDFTPKTGNIADEVILTVTGVNFQPNDPNFEVKLQRGADEFLLDLGDNRTNTSFEAIIRSNQLTETGDYDLVVTNPDGQSDIADDEYRAEE